MWAQPWNEILWAAVGGLGFSLLCLVGHWLIAGPRGGSNPGNAANPSNALAPDQIEAVEGIGPRIAAHLRAHGVDTFAALAAKSPTELRSVLDLDPDFSLAQPMSWPSQARLLRDGRYAEFLRLAVALNAGVPRLEDLNGIGDAIAGRLRGQGIASLEALRDQTADQLSAAADVGVHEAEGWRSQASQILGGDFNSLLDLADLDRLALLPMIGGPKVPDQNPDPIARRPDPIARPHSQQWCAPALAGGLLGLLFMLRLLGQIPEHESDRIPIQISTPCPHATCRFRRDIPADQLFSSGGEELSSEGRQYLDQLAGAIGARAPSADELPGALVIIGHADRMPSRGLGGNDGLSERRARAVELYLQTKLPQWPRDIVFSFGRGSRVPNPEANTAASCSSTMPRVRLVGCLERDRRVEIRVFYLDRR
jgi:predicted flap endonuclease-1-like 5' DNA nuclease/outer membrane protein OmpA-like peptidoglycan-associated protein